MPVSRTCLCVIVIVTRTIISVCHGENTPSRLTQQDHETIEKFISTLIECRQIPALAVTAVTSSEVLLKQGYGFADLENKVRVNEDTLFPIGSCSKAFTSALLAILLSERRDDDPDPITWDTPVHEMLPCDFRLYDEVSSQSATLRDLLAHRTGVPGYFIPIMAGLDPNMTMAEFVRTLRHHKPVSTFRDNSRYNNGMVALAAYVGEVLGGRDIESLLTDYLFTPLNMTSTTFTRQAVTLDRMAKPYAVKDGRFIEVDRTAIKLIKPMVASGGIVSSLRDMAAWLQMLLSNGRLATDKQLIPPASLTEMFLSRQAVPLHVNAREMTKPTFPVADSFISYGLGWLLNHDRGYRRVWHTGGIGTYRSMVALYPELDLAFYIQASGPPKTTTSWAILATLHFISDVILQRVPWLDSDSACVLPSLYHNASTETEPLPDDIPERPLEDFVGTYHHLAFPNVVIAIDDSSSPQHLTLTMGTFMEATLFYSLSKNIFYTKFKNLLSYEEVQVPVLFKTSTRTNGDITSLSVLLDLSLSMKYSTVFTRKIPDAPPAACNHASNHSFSPVLFFLILIPKYSF